MSVLSTFSLKNKVAIVTGGAGLYGQQIVTALAEAGAKTYVASRGLEAIQKLAEEHRSVGNDVTALYLDQGEEASIIALRDEVIKRDGKVDVLVNNAVFRPMNGWNDDAALFDKSMHVNATGIFMLTRAFGDVMAERGSGSIINIGSIQGMIGTDGTLYEGFDWDGYIPDYFFHKGGMINFTRFAASYYGLKNVRCNCISPGGIMTNESDPVLVKRYSARTLLGRMANDSDLMGIIVFLASEASLYITGANIPVDGGYTAK